nr:MAG TPA: hypothetical protein [Caudoviricetes sp.]
MTLDEFRQFWLLLIATDTRIESLDPMQEAAAGIFVGEIPAERSTDLIKELYAVTLYGPPQIPDIAKAWERLKEKDAASAHKKRTLAHLMALINEEKEDVYSETDWVNITDLINRYNRVLESLEPQHRGTAQPLPPYPRPQLKALSTASAHNVHAIANTIGKDLTHV